MHGSKVTILQCAMQSVSATLTQSDGFDADLK